ncbi:MAG: DEAD/DEAH box helicase [Bdellovibrionaceae bacterium]|nr:DEAD/DEAH box helicase [Pseudobdellovibrionaceae bacterium]
MSDLKFSDLKLIEAIQNSLKKIGYETPTPIQEQTIPLVLGGHDVLGIAQTGTGKTAAFCLPIINHLETKKIRLEPRFPRALILTPTRELAIQIHQNLNSLGQFLKQSYSVIFGGVGQGNQVRELKQGVDVLVATPGRLLDLIEQKYIRLDKIEIFVLDEADRMLDMGFLKDIKKLLPLLPKKRHNLFFSATMPSEIQKLANTILNHPKIVEVTPQATTVKKIVQTVMYVDKKNKVNLLVRLLKESKKHKTLVFVEMKHVANKVVEKLEKNGIRAVAIHGNKTQGARQRAIQDFTSGKVQVMVATDIASRGIDIEGITHVINYELSNIAENYVHRIGRTARAGAEGVAISLVTGDEKSYLVNVERTIKQTIAVDKDHHYHSEEALNAEVMKVGRAKAKLEGHRKREAREAFRKNPRKKFKSSQGNKEEGARSPKRPSHSGPRNNSRRSSGNK